MLVWNPDSLSRFRDAVAPDVGLGLESTSSFLGGSEPAVSRYLLTEKTTNITWNYVTVGAGKDLLWWKEFFSVCKLMGYNDWINIDMDDLTTSVETVMRCSARN